MTIITEVTEIIIVHMSTDITIMPNVTIITQTEGHTDLERPTNRLKDRHVNGQRDRQTKWTER